MTRHRARVVPATLVFSLLALAAAQQLKLQADLPALLPDRDPAALDYRKFLELFGGFERVFVLVHAPESTGSESAERVLQAVEELAVELQALPEVAEVRVGLEEEDQVFFFDQVARRAPVLIGEQDLTALARAVEPDALAKRAAELRSLAHSPAGRLQLQLATRDPLGISDRLAAFAGLDSGLPVDPWTSTFMSADGDAGLLLLTPATGEMDASGGRRLDAALQGAFQQVRERLPNDGQLHFAAVGGPLYAAQDEQMIRSDLRATVVGSAVACSLILWLAFGGLTIPAVTLAVLANAMLWAAGALALGLGSLTAAGLGFAAVLVGLGVDYGIHGGARYRGFRLMGRSPAEALDGTFRDAGPAIFTSAMTTACAFSVLAAASFRPLRELGLVVTAGIVAILAAFAVLGSALITWTGGSSRPGPHHQKAAQGDAGRRDGGRLWRGLDALSAAAVSQASRRPRPTLAVALLLTLLAIPGLLNLRLDPDLRALRPKDHPAIGTEKLLFEKFGVGKGTMTVLVSGQDRDEVLERSQRVTERLRAAGGESVSVLSPSDLLTSESGLDRRLEALGAFDLSAVADRLALELEAVNLNSKAFSPGLDALRQFGSGLDVTPLGDAGPPSSMDELLTEDSEGRSWAAVRMRLTDGFWPTGLPAQLEEELKTVDPRVAVASVPRLGAAMKAMAGADFRNLSWVAGILVCGVVAVSFRGRLVSTVLAVLPVLLGGLWTLGLLGASGGSLDLLSLSVIPILLGIGIDDGLHAVHGAHRPGEALPRDLARSVRESGLAMGLTTLTTGIGFSSLALSSIPGLRNGGILVAGGVVLCLVATLWVLPAIGALLPQEEQ